MKRLGLVVLLVGVLASPAMAGTISTGTLGSYGSSFTGIGGGGEFTFSQGTTNWLNLSSAYVNHKTAGLSNGVTGLTFQTFCVEIDEHITTWADYSGSTSPIASLGGVNTNSGDPVSQGTGYLYSTFVKGSLAYDYTLTPTTGRKASAYLLQQAIWWLEGEFGDSAPAPSNSYLTLVATKFGGLTNAKKGQFEEGAHDYGVRALNLTSDACDSRTTGVADPCQDALVMVPDGGATLMLLGGALVGLAALRRKFRG